MKTVYFLFAAMVLFSCSSEKKLSALQQELIEADQAFSMLSSQEGMNKAFEAYCAEQGVLLRPDNMPIVGKDAVKELISSTDDTSFELTWEPLFARAARSGDLGYTYGVFTISMKEGGSTRKGTYLTIWIKESGEWKWALDTGNNGVGD